MSALNAVNLYVNIYTKTLVSVNGSPTTLPPQYYGDQPTFNIFPVIPASNNPNQGYTPFSLAGYTMNLTMADAPNAASPPTPFASHDSMAWDGTINGFSGVVDLTQAAVGTFIGANPSKQAYFNFDVFDVSLNRTTLIQTTFQMTASIDTVTAAPPGNAIVYPTLAQALGMFVLTAPVPGKQIIFQSPDGTKKKQLTLGNDGNELWNTVT